MFVGTDFRGKKVRKNRTFTDVNGVHRSRLWWLNSSKEEKAAAGLEEVPDPVIAPKVRPPVAPEVDAQRELDALDALLPRSLEDLYDILLDAALITVEKVPEKVQERRLRKVRLRGIVRAALPEEEPVIEEPVLEGV